MSPDQIVEPERIVDPPVRADGLCAVCGKPRPEVAVRHYDPFCSSDCCRKHYKLERS